MNIEDKISIKSLSPDKLFQLRELFEYSDLDEMIENNSKRIESGAVEIFVMYLNDSLIGELRVMYFNPDERFAKKGIRAYFYAFRIHNRFQGNGYGKYLLNYVLDVISAKGYSEFTVGVEDDNNRAIHIYKYFGFDKIIARIHEEYQGEYYEYNLYLKSKGDINANRNNPRRD